MAREPAVQRHSRWRLGEIASFRRPFGLSSERNRQPFDILGTLCPRRCRGVTRERGPTDPRKHTFATRSLRGAPWPISAPRVRRMSTRFCPSPKLCACLKFGHEAAVCVAASLGLRESPLSGNLNAHSRPEADLPAARLRTVNARFQGRG
jgi:hypothetical protein